MKTLLAAAAVLALAGPACAFDTDIAAIVDGARPKQVLNADQLMTLMQQSAKWCYKEIEEGGCAWTDVYLDVTTEGVRMEVGNAYDDILDIYRVDQARFKQDRYSCEYDYNWVPALRMVRWADRSALEGRELEEYRVQYANNFGIDDPDCFDYQFVRADAERETITLVQRTWSDFVKDEGSDTLVTLHFNEDEAARLYFIR